MIRLAAMVTLLATPAYAHLGHAGELAGHDHWIGLGALGAAALAAWLAAKGKKTAQAEEETEAEPEESEA